MTSEPGSDTPELSLPAVLARIARDEELVRLAFDERQVIIAQLLATEPPHVCGMSDGTDSWIQYRGVPSEVMPDGVKLPPAAIKSTVRAPQTVPEAVVFTQAINHMGIAVRLFMAERTHLAASFALGRSVRLLTAIISAAFGGDYTIKVPEVVRACGRTFLCTEDYGWREVSAAELDDNGRVMDGAAERARRGRW